MPKSRDFVVIFISLVGLGYVEIASSQIINTTLGLVQGTSLVTRGGRTISAFLGIPYALPPIANLRFLDPQPAVGWEGVRDATAYGPICPQFGSYSNINLPQDEDCLTLNVYAHINETNQKRNKDALLPVFVYIHGGFFMALSGSNYGPKYVMDHDVLFVTLNYRIGILGFLNTEDSNAPGNAGMKDQVLALKWIQDNIVRFGGDPSRVTIYGESAGSAAIHYHLLSASSVGLFSGAIAGSGTAFKIYSHQYAPLKAAQNLADEVGCGRTNRSEMVDCLRSLDARVIAEKSDEFSKVLKDPLRMFSPSTEVNGTSSNPFLTQHPYEVIASGNQQKVPWMAGVNSGEGFITTLNISLSDEWVEKINANWTHGLAQEFLILLKHAENMTKLVDEFYLTTLSSNGSVDFLKDILGFTYLIGDRLYVHASLEAVRMQAKESPVFLYYNDYITSVNSIGLGTFHGEELTLLFSPGNFSEPIIDRDHPDYEQSKTMVDIWVQFVQDPFNVQHNNQIWKPVNSTSSRDDLDCLIFKNPNRGEQDFGKFPEDVINRIDFWKQLGIPPYEED